MEMDDGETLRDRYRGALLGLAVGDALGAAIEFSAPGTFEPVTGMRGGGPFGLKAGYWTDDTSMALCLAESLIECDGFDPIDQLQRYVRWYRTGHLSSTGEFFDIGIATQEALRRFERTGEPYCGSTSINRSGNGSLMRLAPAPLYFSAAPARAIEASGDSSRTTHASVICVDACRYFGGMIVGAVNGASKDQLLSSMFEPARGTWAEGELCAEIAEVAGCSFSEREPPEIVGSGYAAQSLEAALWAFTRSKTFSEAVLLAVNLGDDADTTGAICGQIAGAYYGATAIPRDWLETLAAREMIEGFADKLLQPRVQ
jgi:ADP-ribosylglycohydrolase